MDLKKKLYKSNDDIIIDGVCAGIAEYFDIDPVWVRLLMVLLLFSGGVGLIIYIVGIVIIPRKPKLNENKNEKVFDAEEVNNKSDVKKSSKKNDSNGKIIFGFILLILGVFFLFENYFNIGFDLFFPLILIALGIAILFKRGNNDE